MEYVWMYILLLRITQVFYIGCLIYVPRWCFLFVKTPTLGWLPLPLVLLHQQNSPCWLYQGDQIFEASCYCQSRLQIHYLIHTCLRFSTYCKCGPCLWTLEVIPQSKCFSISDTQMFTFKCRHQRKVATPNISNISSFSIDIALKKL